MDPSKRILELEKKIQRLEQENRRLLLSQQQQQQQQQLINKNNTKCSLQNNNSNNNNTAAVAKTPAAVKVLSKDHVERYSRQLMIKGGFGVQGQRKLLSSSVLVVGAGGIGSTAIMYLAAAGIGRLTIQDFDNVEISNLHRQVIHKSTNVGMNKAISACHFVQTLNETIQCDAICCAITHDNAMDIIKDYDCVVDASDNPKTRYLVNDACVLSGKPLVSGSAIGMEGQLTVYNWNGGPCYRCLYPKPAISSSSCSSGGGGGTAASCSDAGVLGPVPGLVGVLQATETIKILTATTTTTTSGGERGRNYDDDHVNIMRDRLLMYDAAATAFLSVQKPPKQRPNNKCPMCCTTNPTTAIRSMQDSRMDLQESRGPSMGCGGDGCVAAAPPTPSNPPNAAAELLLLLPKECTVSCQEYNRIRNNQEPHVLIDVRVKEQFDMCALDEAINIPLASLPDKLDAIEELSAGGSKPVYCICRRGIASVEAVNILCEAEEAKHASSPSTTTRRKIRSVKNITGGLNAWREQVDESFPKY